MTMNDKIPVMLFFTSEFKRGVSPGTVKRIQIVLTNPSQLYQFTKDYDLLYDELEGKEFQAAFRQLVSEYVTIEEEDE